MSYPRECWDRPYGTFWGREPASPVAHLSYLSRNTARLSAGGRAWSVAGKGPLEHGAVWCRGQLLRKAGCQV